MNRCAQLGYVGRGDQISGERCLGGWGGGGHECRLKHTHLVIFAQAAVTKQRRSIHFQMWYICVSHFLVYVKRKI